MPVLDVKAKTAVLARGGDRDHYAPVRSILHDGADPLGLAAAYRDKLGLDTVYLADLDANASGSTDADLYRRIGELPMEVWVDAGVRTAEDAATVGPTARVIVAGLETIGGPGVLASLVERLGPDRVAFGLDLRVGRPLVPTAESWGTSDPRRIASMAVGLGVSRLIVLDLARVGMGGGVGTLALIAAIRSDHPELDIVAGGGVAGSDDLRRLEDAGASAALVGSALHDGRIGVGTGILRKIVGWVRPRRGRIPPCCGHVERRWVAARWGA